MSGLPAVVSISQLGTGTPTSAALIPASMTVAGVITTRSIRIDQIVTTTFGALPTGGATGQILNKASGTDFIAQWSSASQFVTAGAGLSTAGSTTIAVSLASTAGLSVLGVAGSAQATAAAISGTAAQVLVVNDAGNALAFGKVNLGSSAAVTGVLPAVNVTAVNLGASGPGGVQGVLPVPSGGTNTTALTQNGVLFGNGVSALGITAAGQTGSVLVAPLGATPSFTTSPSIGTSITVPVIIGGILSASNLTLQAGTTGLIVQQLGGTTYASLSTSIFTVSVPSRLVTAVMTGLLTVNAGVAIGTTTDPGIGKLLVATSINISPAASQVGYQINGINILSVNNGTYTQLEDPNGVAKFFFGNTSDPTNYHRNNNHLLQATAGTSFAAVDLLGMHLVPSTSIPAGGITGFGISLSSSNATNVLNFGIFFGTGTPSLIAGTGSIYLRSDGTTATSRMYVNTNGSTTWTAFNTVA